MVDKIGRNDPCPCGSGKKYKKCCMLKDDAGKQTPAQDRHAMESIPSLSIPMAATWKKY